LQQAYSKTHTKVSVHLVQVFQSAAEE